HITLDRRMKGTDQAGSLGPDGVHRMVRDIRILDQSMGIEDIFIVPETAVAKEKLERSIATKRPLDKGAIITEEDIYMLSPGDGFKWAERNQVVGKIIKEAIAENEVIYPNNLM
ncbi:MAG: SAF domain-containing protein, partial [Flavobacterium sp.]|nr:SAF domain-containing protein [Flavobacterium sp.]